MADPIRHAVVGALAALAPDVALATFRWRRRWVPDDARAMRVHHALHQRWWGLVLAALIGWVSHLVLDYFTEHNLAPGVKGRRPWRW